MKVNNNILYLEKAQVTISKDSFAVDSYECRQFYESKSANTSFTMFLPNSLICNVILCANNVFFS